jgi:hypothetical protein
VTKSGLALQADVEAIALPDGRMPGTPGHRQVREYLVRRLERIGLAPYAEGRFGLSYRSPDAPQLEFHNVVAVIPGRDRRAPAVLIGAHYDSVIPAPCADDNAAAVAITLAAAQRLSATAPERDIVVALFDAEEPPYFLSPTMGSVRFYEDQRAGRQIHAAVILDLVGHELALPLPGLANLLVVVGIESSGALPELIDTCPRPTDLPVVVARNAVVGDMSDHHVFRLNDVPYVFLTCGRWEHYHAPTDTPDRLAYRKMALIRDYVVALVQALAATDMSARPVDTTAIEIRYLESAFGRLLPLVLRRLGLTRLSTRADLDRLAIGLQALGL